MPRNANGIYTLPPLNPVVPFTTIATQWANTTLPDIGTALSESISSAGLTNITANLPMNGFRHTSVGAALSATQYAQAGQSQAFVYNIAQNTTVDGSRTAYAAIVPFGIGSTVAIPTHMPLLFVPTQDNAGPSTLALNGGTPYPILNSDNSVLAANTLHANRIYFLVASTVNWILVTNTLDISVLNTQYVRLAGGTMTGPLLLSQEPTTDNMAANKKYVDDAIVVGTAGVASFNLRTGAVTLLSLDVTTALGYTPLNVAGGTMTGALNGTTAGFNTLTTKQSVLTPVIVNPVFGAVGLNFAAGQSQIWTLAATPATVTISGLSAGNIGRLVILSSNLSVPVWPASVIWPMPLAVAPDFGAGPNKKVLITFEFDGTNYLANSSVY